MSESILDHHLGAFGARDVNALLEDYTEDSTIIIPNSVIKGLDNISTIRKGNAHSVSKTLIRAAAGARY